MRDWKSSLYVLSPLVAKDAHLFVKTMNSIARLKDGKMTALPHPHPTNQNSGQDTQRANAVSVQSFFFELFGRFTRCR